MHLKKPKFWDYKEPNIYSYILWPISILIKIINLFKTKQKVKNFKIKTICVGNIYLGGTGKTSLAIKINEILTKKNIKSCFVKKYYENQIDEQRLLKSKGVLFSSHKRAEALNQAVENNYQVAIFDDGLQDYSINYDVHLLCFNSLNWIGNGMTIPSGPLREDIEQLRKYKHVFLNGSSENLTIIKEQILNIHPDINIHEGKYVPVNLNEFELNDEYIAFSGIGNHKTFISMIKEFGIKVIKDIEFPDHYYYKTKDINKILEVSKKLNCKIITTEKDYFRLGENKIDEIKFVKSDLRIINENKFIKTILN